MGYVKQIGTVVLTILQPQLQRNELVRCLVGKVYLLFYFTLMDRYGTPNNMRRFVMLTLLEANRLINRPVLVMFQKHFVHNTRQKRVTSNEAMFKKEWYIEKRINNMEIVLDNDNTREFVLKENSARSKIDEKWQVYILSTTGNPG